MMTPSFAKSRAELPWLPYPENDRVIINAHNFTPPAAIAYDYRGLRFSTVTGTGTRTWTAADIGTASADRYVIVSVFTRTATAIPSLTVGGVSATNIRTQIQSGAQCSVWIVPIASGTTADIVYSHTSVQFFQAISVTAVTGIDSTVLDSDGAASSASLSITTESGGLLLGFHFNFSDPDYGAWTGLTSFSDEYQAGGFGYSFSHAAGTPVSSTTTAGHTGGSTPVFVIISLAAA